MLQLGDKVAAKKVARAIGVPLIQDSKKDLQTVEDALFEAENIGYPAKYKQAENQTNNSPCY